MARSLAEKLAEKGWKIDEIRKAVQLMESPSASDEHVGAQRSVNPIVYWFALMIMILGNLVIAVVMIPFLLVLTSSTVYAVLAVLAFSFGLLFNLVINDIENIDPQHHIIAGLFIPAFAIVTVFVMVGVATRLGQVIQFPVKENPILIGLVYVVAFMLPYVMQKFREFLGARKIRNLVRAG